MLELPPITSGQPLLDQIHHTDLLTLCRALPSGSIDMILCDLPYGTTNCSWDEIIPLAPMWAQFKRVIKPRGAIVLTASQPFTSKLVSSNYEMFRYEWVWNKGRVTGFLDANKKPLKVHESILVFSENAHNYYPKKWWAGGPRKTRSGAGTDSYNKYHSMDRQTDGYQFPTSIVVFTIPNTERGLHPTQKPLNLFSYLIETYTQKGDAVLDPCVGSGTTAVACQNLERHYIAGDNDLRYVETARQRIKNLDELPLFAA